MKWTEVKGRKFGRLTAIEVVGETANYNKLWRCKCDCGNEKVVRQSSLTSGNTRSCGCLNYDQIHLHRRKAEDNCVCEECKKTYYVKPSRVGRTTMHFCSQECRTNYIRKHPEMIPTYKERDEVTKFFCEKYTRSKMSARKRNIPFSDDLSPQHLVDLWKKQKGRCYYSGIEMSFDPKDDIRLVSIDRIDSTKGYEPENIVLCSYAFNSFKFTYQKEKIIEFISMIRRSVVIKVQKSEGGKTPSFATEGSAGADLYLSEDVALSPGERRILPTKIKLEIPYGYFGMCVGRSGNTIKKGLFVQTGIIDSDYRGEIGVMAFNASSEQIILSIGDRIGQIIIMPYPEVEFEEAQELSETDRGAGGYGSSGK